jgi:hypothetical protein
MAIGTAFPVAPYRYAITPVGGARRIRVNILVACYNGRPQNFIEPSIDCQE